VCHACRLLVRPCLLAIFPMATNLAALRGTFGPELAQALAFTGGRRPLRLVPWDASDVPNPTAGVVRAELGVTKPVVADGSTGRADSRQ